MRGATHAVHPAARDSCGPRTGGVGVVLAADTSLQQPKGNVNGMTVVNSGTNLNLGFNFEEIWFSKFFFFSAVNEV